MWIDLRIDLAVVGWRGWLRAGVRASLLLDVLCHGCSAGLMDECWPQFRMTCSEIRAHPALQVGATSSYILGNLENQTQVDGK
jgi:hypothetical protein